MGQRPGVNNGDKPKRRHVPIKKKPATHEMATFSWEITDINIAIYFTYNCMGRRPNLGRLYIIYVQTQLATLPVSKREVPISQPQIRHYGFKLGRPFRQPLRHIITHHKHWIFWIINDHILLIHNILTISLVTISISTIILIISRIFICLFTTQIWWAQAYQCWVLRWEASSFETGGFPFRNGKLPILKLNIL